MSKKLFSKNNIHVDEFIDDYQYNTQELKDARFFLHLHRLSSSLQSAFRKHINDYQLFCDHEGIRYRVTGASRMGDIWLREDHTQDTGYDKRVYIDKCENFELINVRSIPKKAILGLGFCIDD
jgi:hypothetical protein